MADAPYKIFGVHPSRLKVATSTSGTTSIDPFVNAFTMDFNLTTLTFEYSGTSDQVQVGSALTGTIGLGKFNTAILDSIVGVTAETSGLMSGYAKQWNPELGTYPYVQMEIDLRVQDDAASGAETELTIVVWKAKLQNPFAVGDVGNLEANTQTLSWSATSTATDILGAAIPGVTGDEIITYSILKAT
jgi:hypothetical protein